MIEEKKIKRIGELRESGITIYEIAKMLEISESSVKKYSSSDPDKNNEIDKKTPNEMNNIMLLEGYDFQDEIKPLIYMLKAQANELDITLYDYLKDINKVQNKFLRLTDTPERFYYVFCELANNFSVITEHINAENLIGVIDNFYNREIEFEKIEEYLLEQKQECDDYINNKKEELMGLLQQINEAQNKIIEAKEELHKLTSTQSIMIQKIFENPHLEKLEKSEIKINSLQILLQKIAKEAVQHKTENIKLKDLIKENITINNQLKQENSALDMVFDKIRLIFPEEVKSIVSEVSMCESEKL